MKEGARLKTGGRGLHLRLQFAELVRCVTALERVLKDVKMTESTVYTLGVQVGASRERLLIKRAD